MYGARGGQVGYCLPGFVRASGEDSTIVFDLFRVTQAILSLACFSVNSDIRYAKNINRKHETRVAAYQCNPKSKHFFRKTPSASNKSRARPKASKNAHNILKKAL